jgi:cytoskeletal protein CcmA (bactofilin family)
MTSKSILGAGTVVRGSVHGEGDLTIYGRVEGSVTITGELLIAETALIRSDLSARRVIVRGAVLGNISADEAIVLEPGARVDGDLGAPQIGIRPGGLVRGSVSTSGPLAAAPTITGAARLRTSPRAASVAMPAVKTPARPGPAPARPIPAARLVPAPRAVPVPPARHAAPAAPVALAPPLRTASPSEPTVASRPEEPPSAPALAAARTEPAPSPLAKPLAASAPEETYEDVTSPGEFKILDGPPLPVVPALRKNAKASLRRKGAR